MAKKITWSVEAQQDRKDILEYWAHRNKSKVYSRKLDKLFREAIKIILNHPGIGRKTDFENVRAKLVKDYYILYHGENTITILSIWDCRQDSLKLEKKKGFHK
ncbi:MAG: type II toxin-antitoxin system RelE/ParE family toxin [Bacteroidia bacterium]|nr:type II toxin-antitoxin system RelE/ParE family toxin [Bacteroidia bacterium]